MQYTYEILEDNQFGGIGCIRRSDGAIIPTDLTNSDYQTYLRWLENSNAQQGANLND